MISVRLQWSGGLAHTGGAVPEPGSRSAGARSRLASSTSNAELLPDQPPPPVPNQAGLDATSRSVRAEEQMAMKSAGHSSRLNFSAYPDSLRFAGEIYGAVPPTYKAPVAVGSEGRAGQAASIDAQHAIGDNRYVTMTTIQTPGKMDPGASATWTSEGGGSRAGAAKSSVGASGALHGMWAQDLRASK
eukprot:SAG22_NODE_534_length_9397_cov_22.325231_5_plen_188_part_00